MANPPDRKTELFEVWDPDLPLPPANVMAIRSHLPGVVDIRWDDPKTLPANGSFAITGVNVYRSFDSYFGPFIRLNESPIQATFWRDQTQLEWVHEEDVSDRYIWFGDSPTQEPLAQPSFIFATEKKPIVSADPTGCTTSNPEFKISSDARDVIVTVDGTQVTPVAIGGARGEISLEVLSSINPLTERQIDPVLPGPDSITKISYWTPANVVRTDMFNRIFYRVTSVAVVDDVVVETPLASDQVTTSSTQETEPLDYIWKEATRRNRWIAFQGGERFKLFIRKHNGSLCSCVEVNGHNTPRADCPICFGTRIRGGFEGPYEIILPPDEAPKSKRRGVIGQTPSHIRSVWMGPVPLVSQRDFVLHQNGDRYAIGPVTHYTHRGSILQQHFDISMLGELDIRYKVPIFGTDALAFPESRCPAPTGGEAATDALIYPQITEDPSVLNGHEHRGRTPTFENIRHD